MNNRINEKGYESALDKSSSVQNPTPKEVKEYQDLIDHSLKTQIDPMPFTSDAIMDLRTGRIKQVKDNNGDWWILHGECNRCGECCGDRIAKNGSGKWKCNFMRAPIGSANQKESALFQEMVDGEVLYGCRLHWSKPWSCKLYPYDPHETLYPSCSYSWEKLDNVR